MAKNDTYMKKELNKKDYAKKEKVAKVAKGTVETVGLIAIVPILLKGIINAGKKIFRI